MGAERKKLTVLLYLKKPERRSSKQYTSEIRINRPDGSMVYFLFIKLYFVENKDLMGYFTGSRSKNINRIRGTTMNTLSSHTRNREQQETS